MVELSDIAKERNILDKLRNRISFDINNENDHIYINDVKKYNESVSRLNDLKKAYITQGIKEVCN